MISAASPSAVGSRAEALYREHEQRIYRRCDRLFACLMALQWVGGIVAALVISPYAWQGTRSTTHIHVLAAVFLGGAITSLPVALAVFQPGRWYTRQAVAVGQMLTSALLIHLTGGRIETHFHVFGSLAFLAFYRDLRVMLTATVVVAADHFLRGVLWPQSVYGIVMEEPWRWLEHAAWVLFEDVFLVVSIVHSKRDMWRMAERQADVEEAHACVEGQIQERTAQLKHVHQQLIDAARRAGMSEVATGVLHNVGNVLNGVNVSSTLVQDRLRDSRLNQLGRVVQLLEDHQSDLAQFLTENAQGRQLPNFLKLLATHLSTERAETMAEIEGMISKVDHIKTIIATQQSYAGFGGLVEPVNVVTTLEDAVRFNSSSFEKHKIKVVWEHEDLPEVLLDRQRLLQILINLVKNAKESLVTVPWEDRLLTLRVRVTDDDRLIVEVTDSGHGISAEALPKIFSHGFTTKKDGHGFGLHSCAIAAKEMDGSLAVQSDGPGQGATFVLELPFRPVDVAALV